MQKSVLLAHIFTRHQQVTFLTLGLPVDTGEECLSEEFMNNSRSICGQKDGTFTAIITIGLNNQTFNNEGFSLKESNHFSKLKQKKSKLEGIQIKGQCQEFRRHFQNGMSNTNGNTKLVLMDKRKMEFRRDTIFSYKIKNNFEQSIRRSSHDTKPNQEKLIFQRMSVQHSRGVHQDQVCSEQRNGRAITGETSVRRPTFSKRSQGQREKNIEDYLNRRNLRKTRITVLNENESHNSVKQVDKQIRKSKKTKFIQKDAELVQESRYVLYENTRDPLPDRRNLVKNKEKPIFRRNSKLLLNPQDNLNPRNNIKRMDLKTQVGFLTKSAPISDSISSRNFRTSLLFQFPRHLIFHQDSKSAIRSRQDTERIRVLEDSRQKVRLVQVNNLNRRDTYEYQNFIAFDQKYKTNLNRDATSNALELLTTRRQNNVSRRTLQVILFRRNQLITEHFRRGNRAVSYLRRERQTVIPRQLSIIRDFSSERDNIEDDSRRYNYRQIADLSLHKNGSLQRKESKILRIAKEKSVRNNFKIDRLNVLWRKKYNKNNQQHIHTLRKGSIDAVETRAFTISQGRLSTTHHSDKSNRNQDTAEKRRNVNIERNTQRISVKEINNNRFREIENISNNGKVARRLISLLPLWEINIASAFKQKEQAQRESNIIKNLDSSQNELSILRGSRADHKEIRREKAGLLPIRSLIDRKSERNVRISLPHRRNFRSERKLFLSREELLPSQDDSMNENRDGYSKISDLNRRETNFLNRKKSFFIRDRNFNVLSVDQKGSTTYRNLIDSQREPILTYDLYEHFQKHIRTSSFKRRYNERDLNAAKRRELISVRHFTRNIFLENRNGPRIIRKTMMLRFEAPFVQAHVRGFRSSSLIRKDNRKDLNVAKRTIHDFTGKTSSNGRRDSVIIKKIIISRFESPFEQEANEHFRNSIKSSSLVRWDSRKDLNLAKKRALTSVRDYVRKTSSEDRGDSRIIRKITKPQFESLFIQEANKHFQREFRFSSLNRRDKINRDNRIRYFNEAFYRTELTFLSDFTLTDRISSNYKKDSLIFADPALNRGKFSPDLIITKNYGRKSKPAHENLRNNRMFITFIPLSKESLISRESNINTRKDTFSRVLSSYQKTSKNSRKQFLVSGKFSTFQDISENSRDIRFSSSQRRKFNFELRKKNSAFVQRSAERESPFNNKNDGSVFRRDSSKGLRKLVDSKILRDTRDKVRALRDTHLTWSSLIHHSRDNKFTRNIKNFLSNSYIHDVKPGIVKHNWNSLEIYNQFILLFIGLFLIQSKYIQKSFNMNWKPDAAISRDETKMSTFSGLYNLMRLVSAF